MTSFRWTRWALKYIAIGTATSGLALYAVPKALETRRINLQAKQMKVAPSDPNEEAVLADQLARMMAPLPSREHQLNRMMKSSSGNTDEEFDLLVVGGGATGCGVALDAVSRGLNVALVEKFDFASGTSSRSTKLIHGGVRYLQKAIFNLDFDQYRMVREALNERANLLDIAPHLSFPLPIMLPIYKWWQLPYFWVGIKVYDLVSRQNILRSSYFMDKGRALEAFPMLRQENLKCALVYYDGMHEDARMCLSIGLTAAKLGAAISNYVEVLELLKKPKEGASETDELKVCGARCKDRITGKEFQIRAKCVINATGPHTDELRSMSDPKTRKICAPSSGVHLILPDYYSPSNMGLLDPQTSDGRIIFFLPWQNSTIAGTTDRKCEVSDNPIPTEEEVTFILNEVRNYLSPDIDVRRGDVLSAWAGIRPLVFDPKKIDTQSIARNHIVEVSPQGLITIAGGKWTTYREMAEQTVDKAVEVARLKCAHPSRTLGLQLEGAHLWSPTLFIRLAQDYGIETSVAKHLCSIYGDKAVNIAQICQLTGKKWPAAGKRLHPDYPYLEEEVVWACKEYACRTVDVLARRTRIAFLNVQAARECLPRVVDIMAKELGWSKQRKADELVHATQFLQKEMCLDRKYVKKDTDNPSNLNSDDVIELMKLFAKLDIEKKGFISINDLRRQAVIGNRHIDEKQLHDILGEVDSNKNGVIDVDEFIEFYKALNRGINKSGRFQKIMDQKPIPVDRSGGGM